MTDMLHEIEKAHEAKFKLDAEARFKIACRRDKLLGLWAAAKMGLGGAAAEDYARNLVRLGIKTPEGERTVQSVLEDLEQKGLAIPADDIVEARSRFQAEAEADIRDRFPTALDSDHSPVGG